MFPRLIVLLIALVVSVGALGSPAKKGVVRECMLTDGTPVSLQLCGDEYAHWWMDEAGERYTVDSAYVAMPLSTAALTTLQSKGAERKTARNAVRQKRHSRATTTGERRGIVLLVNFLNKSMVSATAQEDYDRRFNEVGFSDDNHIGSVRDYFSDQSYGQFLLDFDIVGPLTLSENYSYYGQNDRYGDDVRACEMVIEACMLADDIVDFSKYDWDGDGEVDQVFIIYAGYGENGGAASNTVWPHEWDLDSGAVLGDGTGAITLDGVRINTYAVACELDGNSGSSLAGIGMACHEFSHCLGLPDFYDTSYSGGWGMQEWDLLDAGSFNGPHYRGEVPSGYTAYERWYAGWLEPTVLRAGTTIASLPSLQTSAEAYVLYNDADPNEYYLFENRSGDGWYKYLMSYTAPSGLLISHVDYDSQSWENDTPNRDADHQRMTMFLANNEKGTYYSYRGQYYLTSSQYQGHLYPYNANDSLTAYSTPAAILYNANSSGEKYMSAGIYDITRNADGTIAFTCEGEETATEPETPAGTTTEVLFYESFDSCSGTGGNDDLWSGNIARSAFLPDNDGWECTTHYGACQCARFGTTSSPAYVVSPLITTYGSSELSFKIGVWDATSEDPNIDLYVGDDLYYLNYLSKGAWTEVTIPFTYAGTWTFTLIADKRFFLDEVTVTATSSAGVDQIATVVSPDNRIYTLSGMFVGTDMSVLPKGIYIINRQKVVKR